MPKILACSALALLGFIDGHRVDTYQLISKLATMGAWTKGRVWKSM